MTDQENPKSALERFGFWRVAAAWMVHIFTGTGVFFAALAALALSQQNYKLMWLWLAICLVVDGIDGTFARMAQVKEIVPWFDGIALDLIIDYISWTFIPALFMYQELEFAPKAHSAWVASLVLGAVLISSMFCYCNKAMKSRDNYFVGFPAAWNIVALYLYLLDGGWQLNLSVTVVLVILTLTPLKFCHPFRVRKMMWVNIVAVLVWFASIIALTVVFPIRPPIVWIAFWVSGLYFIGVGVVRTFVGEDYRPVPKYAGDRPVKERVPKEKRQKRS